MTETNGKTKIHYVIPGILILVIIAIQFIPYGRDHSNPAVASEPEWDSLKTRELFMRACANCHSNETNWPWYSKIAPMSWMIQHDVDDAREHFNISMWGVQKKNKGKFAADEISDGEMPPWMYLVSHSEARLAENEKKELINGLLATFGPVDAGEQHHH